MEERATKGRLCLKLGQRKLAFQQKSQVASNSREDSSTERPVTPPPANPSSNGSFAAKDDSINARETPPLSGLCNLGNTCYVNSLLQPLRFCPQFSQWISELHRRCWQLAEQSSKENESTAEVDQADKEASSQAPGITATNCVSSNNGTQKGKILNGSEPPTKENSSLPTGLATHLHTVNCVANHTHTHISGI